MAHIIDLRGQPWHQTPPYLRQSLLLLLHMLDRLAHNLSILLSLAILLLAHWIANMWSCVWLLCGSGDLNSSLHVFTANAISAVQAGLRLTTLWPLPPEYRDSKHVLRYLVILSSLGHCVRFFHCCQMLVPGNTVTQQSKIQLEV